MGTVGTQDGCGMDAGSAVRTRKQPAGVCPAPRSQTGFGQSAGDFKPFLRHKGHGNKMPVRRRGSAVSRKRGLYTLVRNTRCKPGWPAAQSAFLHLSRVMLWVGLGSPGCLEVLWDSGSQEASLDGGKAVISACQTTGTLSQLAAVHIKPRLVNTQQHGVTIPASSPPSRM